MNKRYIPDLQMDHPTENASRIRLLEIEIEESKVLLISKEKALNRLKKEYNIFLEKHLGQILSGSILYDSHHQESHYPELLEFKKLI